MRHPPETGHPSTRPRKRFRWKASLGERSQWRTRGSRKAYAMSTTMLAARMNIDPHDRDAHHDGEVIGGDGPHRELPEAEEPEEVLRDEQPGHDRREVDPEHRHGRRDRSPERVLVDHAALRGSLRPGRPDVVLAVRPTARHAGSPAGSFTKIRNVRIEMTTSRGRH